VYVLGGGRKNVGERGRDSQPCPNPKPWLPISLVPALLFIVSSVLASIQSLALRTSLLHVWFACRTRLVLDALQVYSLLSSCPHLGLQRGPLAVDGSRLCLPYDINGVSDAFPQTIQPP